MCADVLHPVQLPVRTAGGLRGDRGPLARVDLRHPPAAVRGRREYTYSYRRVGRRVGQRIATGGWAVVWVSV